MVAMLGLDSLVSPQVINLFDHESTVGGSRPEPADVTTSSSSWSPYHPRTVRFLLATRVEATPLSRASKYSTWAKVLSPGRVAGY